MVLISTQASYFDTLGFCIKAVELLLSEDELAKL